MPRVNPKSLPDPKFVDKAKEVNGDYRITPSVSCAGRKEWDHHIIYSENGRLVRLRFYLGKWHKCLLLSDGVTPDYPAMGLTCTRRNTKGEVIAINGISV